MRIETITTPFVLGISVNCYLVEVADGFVLIDTARSGQRGAVEAALARAGCTPGKLKLIILTHGDFDHSGNAAYLRQRFSTRIALHGGDAGMVERGDMFVGRKQPNPLMRWLVGLFAVLPEADRFTPDVLLKEGDDLSAYGLPAQVIELPGQCRAADAGRRTLLRRSAGQHRQTGGLVAGG